MMHVYVVYSELLNSNIFYNILTVFITIVIVNCSSGLGYLRCLVRLC